MANGKAAVPSTKPQPRPKSIPALLYQAVTADEDKLWDKDELLDTLYWTRQLQAVMCGILWGIIPLKGLFAFLGFLCLLYATVVVFFNMKSIDADEFGGAQVLHMEGWPPAVGIFLLAWIATYTLSHS